MLPSRPSGQHESTVTETHETHETPDPSSLLPTLQIIIGSTRPGRIGKPVALWFNECAVGHGSFRVELIDLAEVGLPFLDEPHHPRLRRYEHEHTKRWSATIERGDAFVFVTPEFNHSFSAPLKNAIDYLHVEWQYKAVGFVSYGGVSAGTRAVQALKPVVSALRMVPLAEAVNIPFVHQFLDEHRGLEVNELLRGAAKSMLDELARVTAAMAPLRAASEEG
jgi:NAD(P)H-dependent FMN reductase